MEARGSARQVVGDHLALNEAKNSARRLGAGGTCCAGTSAEEACCKDTGSAMDLCPTGGPSTRPFVGGQGRRGGHTRRVLEYDHEDQGKRMGHQITWRKGTPER